jgi:uncharacterized protein (TIGR03067 family)
MSRHGVRSFVSCLTLCVLVTSSGANDPGPIATDDRMQIKGTWQLVYAETEGKLAPVERIRNVRVEINEGTHSVYFGDQRVAHDVRFTMDPQAKPKTTDDTLNDGPEAGKQIHGIYELDGDTLISCVAKVGQDRPGEFAARPGSGHTLRVFKRVRTDEPSSAKAVREELMRFGGTWRFAIYEIDGRRPQIAERAKDRLILRGDRWELMSPEGDSRGFYKVDPTRMPKTIEISFTDGTAKGATLRGIYELTGDTYKVCINLGGGPLPKEFATSQGSQRALEVLNRQNP